MQVASSALALAGLGYSMSKTTRRDFDPRFAILENTNTEYCENPAFLEREKMRQSWEKASRPLETGVIPRNTIHQSLSGKYMTDEEFRHNNMIPFFGSQNRQPSVSNTAYQSQLETFTGTSSTYIQKQEQSPLFSPQFTRNDHIYGKKVHDSDLFTHYNPSRYRQGEPVQDPVHVGPGINKGYTSLPSGGFQQMDSREFAMPKDTNELRVASKPKVSYEGVVVEGHKEYQRGLPPEKVEQQRPTRYYENTLSRATPTSSSTKETARSEVLDKETQRQSSISSYIGTSGSKQVQRGRQEGETYSLPKNTPLQGFGLTHAFSLQHPNHWDEPSPSSVALSKTTDRGHHEHNAFFSNVVQLVQSIFVPIQDFLRPTLKETTVDDTNPVGYTRVACPKSTAYDPSDTARTTLKEQLVQDGTNYGGILKPSTQQKGIVYDPSSHIAKPTIKETQLMDESTSGSIYYPAQQIVIQNNDTIRTTIKDINIEAAWGGGHVTGGSICLQVYDPCEISKRTVKETLLHDADRLNLASQQRSSTVYDPSDVTKTTIKETQIHDTSSYTHIGPVQSGLGYGSKMESSLSCPDTMKRTTKDTLLHESKKVNVHRVGLPEPSQYETYDRTKTTMKETNIENNQLSGNIQHTQTQLGYLTNEVQVPTTSKEQTSDHEYVGDASRPSTGAYQISEYDAKETAKQSLSDIEYTGNADFGVKQSTIYDDMYDNTSLNENKQRVSVGRAPTQTNVKMSQGSDTVYFSKTKSEDCNERDLSFTKVISLFSAPSPTTVLDKERQSYKEENRHDKEIMLQALESNPYIVKLSL